MSNWKMVLKVLGITCCVVLAFYGFVLAVHVIANWLATIQTHIP